jgi:hypothetical protein
VLRQSRYWIHKDKHNQYRAVVGDCSRCGDARSLGDSIRWVFAIHGFAVSGADPAVRVVCGQGALVAAAQLERGGRFPWAGEPAYLVQFCGAELGGEPAESASGFHGAELERITDA